MRLISKLRRRVLKAARKAFKECNGRPWSVRGQKEFQAELERRRDGERAAARVLSKLRSVVEEADAVARENPTENLLVANPLSELVGWVRRFRPAVEALRHPGNASKAGARHSTNERVLVLDMFGLDAFGLAVPAGAAKLDSTAGPPLTVIAAERLPGVQTVRQRNARELAAIGVLCGLWDAVYDDGAYSRDEVLEIEADKYTELLRGRDRRRRRVP